MTVRTAFLAGVLGILIGSTSSAQQDDVTFFVIGKHANFDQAPDGELSEVDYSFFAEVFLAEGGDASGASLKLPTGERIPYEDMRLAAGGKKDNVLLVSGEDRFTSFAGLQGRYPDGDYGVTFGTPSGSVNGALTFQERPLPAAPTITVRQGGRPCQHLEPGVDALVSWTAFADGRADPNGILDDLIFAILTDDEGVRVAHSGRPFEGKPYLTYASDDFLIHGAVLKPGASYTLSVEHALLDDTTTFDNVPAFTTRAVTTRLELTTASSVSGGCGASSAESRPPLDEQITMLYYENLDAATRFYGETLGLEKTFDWEWIRFYRTGPASSVGIVREGDGAWHEAQGKNAVMLSLVTSDVDAWYARVHNKEGVVILKDIGDGGGIRSFLLADPGGYTVEFFEWLEAADE